MLKQKIVFQKDLVVSKKNQIYSEVIGRLVGSEKNVLTFL